MLSSTFLLLLVTVRNKSVLILALVWCIKLQTTAYIHNLSLGFASYALLEIQPRRRLSTYKQTVTVFSPINTGHSHYNVQVF